MKSTQLLSVVFSLMMFTGVTMGNAVFAESDDLKDSLEGFCEMTSEQQRTFFSDNPDMVELDERLSTICDIEDKDEREIALDELIDQVILETKDEEHDDEIDNDIREDDDIQEDKDELKDKYSNSGTGNLRDHFAMYCDMTEEKRLEKMQMHADLPDDLREKLARYCEMSEDEQDDFRDSMKDKMNDKSHMDYDRICSLSESDRAAEIVDAEKLERISKWCDMTPEEREDYKKEHHDEAKDLKKEHHDEAKDLKKEHHDEAKDLKKYKKSLEKMKEQMEKSPRLKSLIMEKHGDEDREHEIKMKFESKHGDGEKIKSEVKIKFKNHMAEMKIKMSDERKSAILDRVSEMREFKMEMRENTTDLTDEEKQELRAQFVEKAQEIRLAWISPHNQMNAGIDAAEIECREGFSLVLKESNGVPMCLKANTALKMIERGIAVPAN